MATYRLKAEAYLKYATYKWKACLVFAIFVAAAILCNHPETSWIARYPQLNSMLPHLYGVAIIGAILSFGSIFALYYAPKIVMTMEIRFTPEGLVRAGGGGAEIFLRWEDITGYHERRNSILLLTADPNRCISISSDFERYAEIKDELTSRGIIGLGSDRVYLPLQNPALLLALASVILLLLGQTFGRPFAIENLYVAAAGAGIGYLGWRNQFRQKSRTLFVLFLVLAGEIFMVVPRSRGNAWELSYLGLNGVLGLIAYGVSAFRERHP